MKEEEKQIKKPACLTDKKKGPGAEDVNDQAQKQAW